MDAVWLELSCLGVRGKRCRGVYGRHARFRPRMGPFEPFVAIPGQAYCGHVGGRCPEDGHKRRKGRGARTGPQGASIDAAGARGRAIGREGSESRHGESASLGSLATFARTPRCGLKWKLSQTNWGGSYTIPAPGRRVLIAKKGAVRSPANELQTQMGIWGEWHLKCLGDSYFFRASGH